MFTKKFYQNIYEICSNIYMNEQIVFFFININLLELNKDIVSMPSLNNKIVNDNIF